MLKDIAEESCAEHAATSVWAEKTVTHLLFSDSAAIALKNVGKRNAVDGTGKTQYAVLYTL